MLVSNHAPWVICCALLVACEGDLLSPVSVGKKAPARAIERAAAAGEDARLFEAPPQDDNGRYICSEQKGSVRELRRLTPQQYKNVVLALFDGVVTPSPRFASATGKSLSGYSHEPQLLTLDETGVEAVLQAAEDVALQIPAVLTTLLPCAQTSPDAACAASFIDTFGTRALRSTLFAAEREALLQSYTRARSAGAAFDESVALVTATLLQMPRFVYAVEIGEGDGAVRKLSSAELAARLAFTLWDSLPDAALLEAVREGRLASATELRAQATRMLNDMRARAVMARFVREWAGVTLLAGGTKDAHLYPNFDDTLADGLNEELEAFVADVIANGKSVRELLTSSETFLNERLASHYGAAPVVGDALQRAELPREHAGLLTKGALLAGFAGDRETSYVRRGKFVRKQLLCNSLGAPPPNAESAFASLVIPQNPTQRQKSEVVRSSSACVGCHSLMDPAGLAFEHFDATGAYRATYENGAEIVTADTLTASPVGAFTDARDLAEKLADSGAVEPCISKHWLRFVLAREDAPADACALQTLTDTMRESNGSIAEMMLAVVGTDAFVNRAVLEEVP